MIALPTTLGRTYATRSLMFFVHVMGIEGGWCQRHQSKKDDSFENFHGWWPWSLKVEQMFETATGYLGSDSKLNCQTCQKTVLVGSAYTLYVPHGNLVIGQAPNHLAVLVHSN